MTVLIILIMFLMVLLAAAGFAYVYLVNSWRGQKNYERGLKMVPVLIHLAPDLRPTACWAGNYSQQRRGAVLRSSAGAAAGRSGAGDC
jgi:hypothetical protein